MELVRVVGLAARLTRAGRAARMHARMPLESRRHYGLFGFGRQPDKSEPYSPYSWVELDIRAYPEGNYVACHCEKCQTKNRQDEGWRHRRRTALEVFQRSEQYARESRQFGLTPKDDLAHREYECDRCRDDDKRRVDSDDEDEDDDEEEEAASTSTSECSAGVCGSIWQHCASPSC